VPAPGAALAFALQAAIVVAAVAGLVRVARLRAFADDARLRRLGWFFGLLAGALGVEVVVTAFLVGQHGHPGGAAPPSLTVLVLLHHGLMLAALALALRTFAVPWHAAGPAALAPALLVVRHDPHFFVLGMTEALLTLYLAVAGFVNHRRRRTKGALRVAAAFLLVFLGHLAFFLVLHHHGEVRPFWGEALTLAGVLLLVRSVPRERGP
jgi:hypothetical protein